MISQSKERGNLSCCNGGRLSLKALEAAQRFPCKPSFYEIEEGKIENSKRRMYQ